jgi:hypothetical protein
LEERFGGKIGEHPMITTPFVQSSIYHAEASTSPKG